MTPKKETDKTRRGDCPTRSVNAQQMEDAVYFLLPKADKEIGVVIEFLR